MRNIVWWHSSKGPSAVIFTDANEAFAFVVGMTSAVSDSKSTEIFGDYNYNAGDPWSALRVGRRVEEDPKH